MESTPSDRIVVTCSADDRYAAPLTTMLKSVEVNLRAGAVADVFVLSVGIGWRSRRKMAASLDPARMHLHWIRVPRLVRSFPVFGHVSPATYSRLLMPELLPPSVTKAIYLDADTIVLGDVAELWAIDMQGKPLLAVQENDTVVSSPYGIVAYKELGLPPDAKYLNAGVLVMDVAQWRQKRIHHRIMEYLHRYREKVLFWDQDGINAVLATQWGELGEEWNFRVSPPRTVPGKTDEEAIADVVRQGRIVHYASGVKPWDAEAIHPAKRLFFDYLALTVWRGWKPKPPPRRRWGIHDYGRFIRQLPVIGTLWRLLRDFQKRASKEHQ